MGDWLGRPPYRVAAIGRPGDVAMMTSPGAAELVERMAGDRREELLAENDVAARIALRVPLYSPGRHAAKISAPTLVQLATKDDVTPYAKAKKIVARIPQGRVRSYDCTHFEPYLDPHFEQIVTDQIALPGPTRPGGLTPRRRNSWPHLIGWPAVADSDFGQLDLTGTTVGAVWSCWSVIGICWVRAYFPIVTNSAPH